MVAIGEVIVDKQVEGNRPSQTEEVERRRLRPKDPKMGPVGWWVLKTLATQAMLALLHYLWNLPHKVSGALRRKR